MTSSHQLVREPQQARSRKSFDRALDAAVALLVERGTPSFTLVEVSKRAGVSTGSMYGRVASKDDLIRVAHAREMERLSAEAAAAFGSLPAEMSHIDRIQLAIEALADLLQENAGVLSPFMLLANQDEVIATAGKAAYDAMNREFERAMGGSAAATVRTRRAVRWSCTVVYSVLARQLALGSDPGAAADYDLEQVIDELVAMTSAYLAQAQI